MAFSYYKSITLDHTQAGSADSTDWPLTIGRGVGPQGADTDLKTVSNGGFVQNSNGYDIRPYSDSALTSPLTYELVYYDATTGSLEMHVKIPTLSHTSDTVIYLAFGDASVSTDGSSTATWNSNFVHVYHFKDGSSLNVNDSTGNANNLTNHGAGADAGQIDGAVVTTTSWYLITSTASGGAAGAVTIQAILKPADVTAPSYILDYGASEPQSVSILSGYQSGKWNIFKNAYPTGTASDTQMTATINVPNFIAYSSDTSSVFGYLNGSQVVNVSGNLTRTGAPTGLGISGAISGPGDGGYYLGTTDELRISKVNLSASWILADYNSQKASSTFISWGTKISTVWPVIASSKGAGTTSAVDTTGAKLIVLWGYGVVSTPSFSDSKGNTWIPLTALNPSSYVSQLAYCINPTVGSGHTFTNTQSAAGISMIALSNAGAISYSNEAGLAGVSFGAFQDTGLTPGGNNGLVIAGYQDGGAPSDVLSIDSGFTIQEADHGSPTGAILCYLVQTTAAFTNPTVSGSGIAYTTLALASFIVSSGGTTPGNFFHM